MASASRFRVRRARHAGGAEQAVAIRSASWLDSARQRMFIRFSLAKAALMNRNSQTCHAPSSPQFTAKQGHYLAFIHAYTCINKRPPAEADMQRYFEVTPPSVHQMVLGLERRGLIERQPGKPRSIRLLVAPESLPILR